MARPARKLAGRTRGTTRLLYISISIKPNVGQGPATSRGASKKRSEKRKRKKNKETAEHPKTKRPKKRSPSPLRGVRKQRGRRRRVRFSRAEQPLPPFFLFMAQHRPQLRKSHPRWTAVETVKKLGRMWHAQPKKDKEMYKEQTAALRKKNKRRA